MNEVRSDDENIRDEEKRDLKDLSERLEEGKLILINEDPFAWLAKIDKYNFNHTIHTLIIENGFTKYTQDIERFLAHIEKFSNLQNLSLPHNHLDDDFIVAFKEFYSRNFFTLKSFNLQNNQITEASIRILINLLSHSSELNLFLNNNPINFQDSLFSDMASRGSFFSNQRSNGNIFLCPINFSLFLRKNAIQFSFSLQLLPLVIKCQKIKSLDFRDNEKRGNCISNKDFMAIIPLILTPDSPVIKIILSACSAFSEGIKLLADMLGENSGNLAYLYIINYREEYWLPCDSRGSKTQEFNYDNGISNETAIRLIECLQTNTSLIILNLAYNKNIDGAIAPCLRDSLWQNKTLTTLNLEGTGIGAPNLKDFMKEIMPKKRGKYNSSLCSLKIYHYLPRSYTQAIRNSLTKFNTENSSRKHNFVTAVGKANIEEVRKFSKEASIYVTDDNGDHLLHIAIRKKHVKCVEFFVRECKYNLELTNKTNQTPLALALEMQKQDSEVDDENLETIIEILKNPSPKLDKKLPVSRSTTSPKPTLKRKAADGSKSGKNSGSNKKPKTANSQTKTVPAPIASVTTSTRSKSIVPSKNALQMDIADKSDEENVPDEIVFELIASGDLHQLKMKLIQTPQLIHLQHSNARLTPLAYTIELLKTGHFISKNQMNCMLIVHALLKSGADVSGGILHAAIQIGNYRLMKLLLNSSKCEPNEKDDNGNTPLICAILKENLDMVSRLLIDRRLNIQVIRDARDFAKQLQKQKLFLTPYACISMENPLQKIIFKLEWRCEVSIPEERSGIQWVKSHTLFYGSSSERSQKALKISSDKEHAYLASVNSYTKTVYQNEGEENPQTLLGKSGNPVTASLIFIISTGVNTPFCTKTRTKIRVPLNFNETHHLADSNEKTVEAVKHRASSAPQDAYEGTFPQRTPYCQPLSPEAIEQKYEDMQKNGDPGFYQLFHHGEQSLMDDLEQEETVVKIVQQLIIHPKYSQGAKVYAVILDLYSPRYPCENCEIAILGEQNVEKSKFLNILGTVLKNHGFILPTFNPIRMITQISSHFEHNSSVITEEEHIALMVDIRSCNNNLILTRDLNSSEAKITQYHSTHTKTP